MKKAGTIQTLLIIVLIAITQASDPISIEEANSRDGVTVSLSGPDEPVIAGDVVEFQITYGFEQSGRYMNVFALTHNHPEPTAEILLFRPDGTFYAVIRAQGFAGNFPNHEYLMYPKSSVTFSTTMATAVNADEPTLLRIPPGKYKAQVATYDKFWLGEWARKDSLAKPAIFSNTAEFEVRPK